MTPIWRALVVAGLMGGAATAPAGAQEVVLRFHSFLSGTSYPHELFFEPWCERIREQSRGGAWSARSSRRCSLADRRPT